MKEKIKCESLSITFFLSGFINFQENVCNLVLLQLLILRHNTGKNVTSIAKLRAIHLLDECMRGNMFFGGIKLIEWGDDIDGDCCPDANGNTQCVTNAENVMVSLCLERSCGMEGKKIWGENGKRRTITFKWQIGI